MSLYYLLKGLGNRIEPVVYCCEDGPAVDFYRNQGIRTEVDRRIARWPHCTIQFQELRPWKLKTYRDALFYTRQAIKFPLAFQAIREIVEREKPDLVHLNSSVLVPEGIAAHRLGLPVVWHLRDFLENGNFGIRRTVISKVIRSCSTRIIALCQAEADRVGPTDKMRVIPNFVERSFFQKPNLVQDLRTTNRLLADAKLVGQLGWSNPDKGAEVAIRAMPEILRHVPEAALFLIGTDAGWAAKKDPLHKALLRKTGILDAPFPQHIRSLAHQLGVAHRVFFPGTFFEISAIIRQLDVVLVPFTVPHFARPVLEAGALGIPVVASDIDGPAEMVDNGRAGLLAKPGDPASLAEQTIMALTGNTSDLVKALHERVATVYSAERNIEATWRVYQEALRGGL
jgi:glycosyltransferase involved in cell wall biosynthesis